MMANPDTMTVLRDALASGDSDAICAALQDMIIFKAVNPLAPSDLDEVVEVLDLGGRAAGTALQVLHAAAVRQGTLPADTEAAAGRLRAVVERSRDDPDGRMAIRDAIHLLARMDDPMPIEQLAYDVRHFDGVRVKKEDYCHPAMAGMLRRHDAELAALQAALGESRAAREIGAIREYALDPAAYEGRVRLMQEDEVEVL
jgi:hypothetical protein